MIQQLTISRFRFVAPIVSVLCLAGCSSEIPVAPVEGVVTLDDKPLADIRVVFQPASSNSSEAGIGSYGITDAQGHFALRLTTTDEPGAVVGKHTVTLSDKKVENASDADAGFAPDIPKSRIPPKYQESPLSFDVQSGTKNEPKFDLKSQ